MRRKRERKRREGEREKSVSNDLGKRSRLSPTKALNYDVLFQGSRNHRSMLVSIDWNCDNDYHGQGRAIETNGGGSRREVIGDKNEGRRKKENTRRAIFVDRTSGPHSSNSPRTRRLFRVFAIFRRAIVRRNYRVARLLLRESIIIRVIIWTRRDEVSYDKPREKKTEQSGLLALQNYSKHARLFKIVVAVCSIWTWRWIAR